MKKLNNRGFLLVETVIVSVFVLTIFMLIFQNSVPMIDEYRQRIRYDDVDSVYDINLFRRLLISSENYSTVLKQVNNEGYMNVGDCNNRMIYNSSETYNLCNNLKTYLEMNNGESRVYLTKWNIPDSLIERENLPRGFLEYVKYIKKQDEGITGPATYRLILSHYKTYTIYNEKYPGGKQITENRYANIGV